MVAAEEGEDLELDSEAGDQGREYMSGKVRQRSSK